MTRGPDFIDRDLIETEVARGRSNRWIMDAYGLTYAQLRTFLDVMADDTVTVPHPRRAT